MSKAGTGRLLWLVCSCAVASGCASADDVESRTEYLGEGDAGVDDAAAIPGAPETTEDLLAQETLLWEPVDGVFLESQFELVEGEVIVEGDISLGSPEEALEDYRISYGRFRANGVSNTRNVAKWDAGRIRYMVASNSDVIPNRCRSTCLVPWCGDGVQDDGEDCDPGSSPGCDPTCSFVFE